MRSLIVNADDFGLTRGVSAGILAAYRHGIVSSTTVMITLDLDREQLAQARGCGLGLGLHTVRDAKYTVPIQVEQRAGVAAHLPCTLRK